MMHRDRATSGSPYGYPAVIHALKGLSTKKIGISIWQRGYYDHILRNDADLAETRQYILNNPQKWIQDKD